MLCSLSTKLGAIKTLEKELGKTLLAFSCYPLKPAEISKDQLAKVQEVEKKLGISLVAVSS